MDIKSPSSNMFNFPSNSQVQFFYTSGVLSSVISYHRNTGLKHGPVFEYNRNKEVKTVSIYKNGIIEKRWNFFSKQRLQSFEPFKKGKLNGNVYKFWINGKISSITPYLMGEKIGTFLAFSNTGTLIQSEYFTRKHTRGQDCGYDIYDEWVGLCDKCLNEHDDSSDYELYETGYDSECDNYKSDSDSELSVSDSYSESETESEYEF